VVRKKNPQRRIAKRSLSGKEKGEGTEIGQIKIVKEAREDSSREGKRKMRVRDWEDLDLIAKEAAGRGGRKGPVGCENGEP